MVMSRVLERHDEQRTWPDEHGRRKRMAERNPLGFPSSRLYEKAVKNYPFATFADMTGRTERRRIGATVLFAHMPCSFDLGY